MAGNTKERITLSALSLFAQSGYSGTSMNDIASTLGITKAALYRHFSGKREILDSIVERMRKADTERAGEYRMPETELNAFSEEYPNTSAESIRSYSMAQFEYWTKDPFAANFRKMLTLEQYRDPQLAALYRDYIAAGQAKYMAAIFRGYSGSEAEAMQLALDFYGPMFLLYSVYDTAEDKDGVAALLDEHIKRFFASLCGCKEGNAHAADEQGR